MAIARTLTTLSVVCLLFLAGCATDQVEYVDEQGNVLAQDEAGEPIWPNSARTATGPADPTDPEIQVGDVFPAPSGSAPIAFPGTSRQVTEPTLPTKAAARKRVYPVATPAASDPLGAPPTGSAPASVTPAYGPRIAPTAPAPTAADPVKPASSSAGLDTPPTER